VVLGSFDDSETIAAAKEMRRFSSWFARDVAVFMSAARQEWFQMLDLKPLNDWVVRSIRQLH
jgi:hypothetical protein